MDLTKLLISKSLWPRIEQILWTLLFYVQEDLIAKLNFLYQTEGRKKRLVFQMNLIDEVDLEEYVSRPDKISAAEITAICQEAGMHAVRKNRYVILPKDFEKGYRANVKKPDTDFEFYK